MENVKIDTPHEKGHALRMRHACPHYQQGHLLELKHTKNTLYSTSIQYSFFFCLLLVKFYLIPASLFCGLIEFRVNNGNCYISHLGNKYCISNKTLYQYNLLVYNFINK